MGKLKKIIAMFILGLLVLSFLVWGVLDYYTRSEQDEIVVSYGDIEIRWSGLLNRFRDEVLQIKAKTGLNDLDGLFWNKDFLNYVLSMMVVEGSYDLVVDKLDLSVPNSLLGDVIAQNTQFQDESGVFRAQLFLDYLKNYNIQEEVYFNLVKIQILRSVLADAFNKGTVVPRLLYSPFRDYHFESREIRLLYLPYDGADSKSQKASPAAKELEILYEQRKEEFRLPEYRKYKLYSLTENDLKKGFYFSKDSVQEEYGKTIDQYKTEDSFHLTQVLFDTKESFEHALGLPLVGEEDLSKLQGQINEFGFVEREAIPQEVLVELEKVLLSGGKGYTAPLKSDLGGSLYYVHEFKEGKVKPFEEVRQDIENRLYKEKFDRYIYDMQSIVEDNIKSGEEFEVLVESIGGSISRTDWIDPEGKTPKGKVYPFQGGVQSILSELELLLPGENTDVYPVDNGIVVLNLQEVKPSRIQEPKEVKTQLLNYWRAAKKKENVLSQVNLWKESLDKGDSLSAIARRVRKVVHQALIERNEDAEVKINEKIVLHKKVLENIFKIPLKGYQILEGEQGAMLVFIDNVHSIPKTAGEDAEDLMEKFYGNLDSQLRQGMIRMLSESLHETEGLSIHHEVIERNFQKAKDLYFPQ